MQPGQYKPIALWQHCAAVLLGIEGRYRCYYNNQLHHEGNCCTGPTGYRIVRCWIHTCLQTAGHSNICSDCAFAAALTSAAPAVVAVAAVLLCCATDAAFAGLATVLTAA